MLGFFMTCLAIALPAISLLNFVIRPSKEPYVSVTVDRVSTRLGVEDYFMNRKVMLTDLSLDLEAGMLVKSFIFNFDIFYLCISIINGLIFMGNLEHIIRDGGLYHYLVQCDNL